MYPTKVWCGEGDFYSVCPRAGVLAGVSDTSAKGAVTVVFFVAWWFRSRVVHFRFFRFQEAVMFWVGILWVAIVGDGNVRVGIVCVVIVGVGVIFGVVIMRVWFGVAVDGGVWVRPCFWLGPWLRFGLWVGVGPLVGVRPWIGFSHCVGVSPWVVFGVGVGVGVGDWSMSSPVLVCVHESLPFSSSYQL